MNMMGGGILIIIGVILVALAGLGFILARLYRRASKEIAFVRTGFGGQKVVKDGGALVLPIFHETIPVNMNTLRLEVRRANENALITADRMRVDVSAEFYVRVKPDEGAIATAAQTLGQRTMNPASLKELVEGKFVDALRAVAAEMRMEELHEQRVHFVQRVQQSVAEDLNKNGLELESVSLTGLDQTSKEYFNPDNAFDAQGLTELTRQVEAKRKIRNDIERDTHIEIEKKNLETERSSLEITRDEEYARFQQQEEVETRRAETESSIKSEQARRRQEAESADILAERDIAVARERAQREERNAAIEKERDLRIAEQEKSIAIATKSEEESVAAAQADTKRAEAVRASEEVITVREVAEAERRKSVALVAAREDAEKQAVEVTVAADAEKMAAEDSAEAVQIHARGEAEAIRIKADADERRLEVEAQGVRILNEARNLLGNDQIGLEIKLALIQALPDIIREQVKPIESIEGIRIMDVRGLGDNSGTGNSTGDTGPANGNLADQAVQAALRYRTQVPILDQLLREIGMEGDQAFDSLLKSPVPAASSDIDPTGSDSSAGEPAEGAATTMAESSATTDQSEQPDPENRSNQTN